MRVHNSLIAKMIYGGRLHKARAHLFHFFNPAVRNGGNTNLSSLVDLWINKME